ncbi:restriction endonuclease [Streptomyces poonensis]|uniref:Restriction endonuclease n=1 Tax=Streptomyces poonensis TaxID=68255 RepID=A0A918UEV9_9ACTN|nr:restriction endonuclease [Streptomyces poonensis]GGY99147.1 restriction endonuclease [Streptomyces poonensis]
MATPTRRTRPVDRKRTFDLRSTALFFGLLAVMVSLAGFTVRALADVVERRPVWAVVLATTGVAPVVAFRRGRRRSSAARAVRRAAEALDEATRTAVDELDAGAPRGRDVTVAAPTAEDGAAAGDTGVERTLVLPDDGTAAYGTTTYEASESYEMYETCDMHEATVTVDYDALDADEFEQATAALCERDGCVEVEVVGGAGDLGADVLAVAPDGRSVVIQCKRYGETNRVGSQDLQRFGGTCFTVHGADVAVVVTTSGFTAPAAEYAEQCGIVCVDRDALLAWSDGTGPPPWRSPVPAPDQEPRL